MDKYSVLATRAMILATVIAVPLVLLLCGLLWWRVAP